MRRDEHGYIGLWVLGVAVMVLFLGGITIDLWRAVAVRRAVAAAVDGAAVAGASGLDEAAFRASAGGLVRLDPDRAYELAAASLDAQRGSDRLTDIAIDATPARITVTATTRVDFTLLKVLLPGEPPLAVTATAAADPRTPAG